MFGNQLVSHFIDTFSTSVVVPVVVVGWVEAGAETHHIHPPFIDGFRCALPILRVLYIPALTAWQYNPLIRISCQCLEAKEKNGNAIAYELIHIAFAILQSGCP